MPDKINYFADEKARNRVLYGSEERYSAPTDSFWYNILPLLFDKYVKRNQPDEDYVELFDSSGVPYMERILIRLNNTVMRALFHFTDTPERREATDEEIEEYKKRKDLLGIIANLDSLFSTNDYLFGYKRLLNFLSHHQNYEISLKDFLPKPLEEEYVRNFKGIFYLFARETGNDSIKTEIDKFKFKFSAKALKKLPKAEGFSVADTNNIRSVIVFKRASFSAKQEQLLSDLLTTDVDLIEGIIFEDCLFKEELKIKGHCLQPRVLFKNSRFQGKISFPDIMRRRCAFKNCFIEGWLNFYETYFAKSFSIRNCIFSEGSTLTLSKTNFNNPFKDGEIRSVIISDNVFEGRLEFDNAYLNCKLLMKNLSFFAPFDFTGTEFSHFCTFENFAFVSGDNPKIEHSKQILSELLIKYGYTSDASKLGLSLKEKKSNSFDYDAYQAAYDSGWLKPEYAAYFLGKSVNYLAKKRMADKKKATQQSLPFKGESKDIQYPVDALLAFKAKDWDTLKNLRKKYPIPTK